MSLLDPTVKTIIVTPYKQNRKQEWLHGAKPGWELKDEQGILLGKFNMVDKDKKHILYNSDNSILIKLHEFGYFNPGFDVIDSDKNLLGKVKVVKKGPHLENSKGEEILMTELSSYYGLKTIHDKVQKIIFEVDFNKFNWNVFSKKKQRWTIKILDSSFDRIVILGFVVSLFALKSGVGYNP